MKLIKVTNIKTNETRYFTKIAYASEFINEGYHSTKYAVYSDSQKPFKHKWIIETTTDPEIKNIDIVK